MHPNPDPSVNPSTVPVSAHVDGDLAEQANPGHGIPSQDPDLAAQQVLTPQEASRESQSALVGGGMVAGAAAGAVVGGAVAGPVGVFVGGTAGAIAGALGGGVAGQPTATDTAPASGKAPQSDRS